MPVSNEDVKQAVSAIEANVKAILEALTQSAGGTEIRPTTVHAKRVRATELIAPDPIIDGCCGEDPAPPTTLRTLGDVIDLLRRLVTYLEFVYARL